MLFFLAVLLAACAADMMEPARVATPAGYAHPDCVHGVPQHAILRRDENDDIHVYDAEYKFIRTLPKCPYPKFSLPMNQGNGWQAWTWDKHATAIDAFNGTFSIPEMPAQRQGQLLYIFTALQNACCGEGQCTNGTTKPKLTYDASDAVCDIIQPVLQLGIGPSGGNDGEWCISNWYIAPDGRYIHNTCTKVTPGGQVFGAMFQIGGQWELVFTEKGGAGTSVTMKIQGIQAPPPQMVAYTTLETYNTPSCAGYPTSTIQFRDMVYQAGGKPYTPKWTSTRAYDNCNQHAYINSPSSVDIKF